MSEPTGNPEIYDYATIEIDGEEKNLDNVSVDEYRDYLKKKWPMDDVVEVDGHPILKVKS